MRAVMNICFWFLRSVPAYTYATAFCPFPATSPSPHHLLDRIIPLCCPHVCLFTIILYISLYTFAVRYACLPCASAATLLLLFICLPKFVLLPLSSHHAAFSPSVPHCASLLPPTFPSAAYLLDT